MGKVNFSRIINKYGFAGMIANMRKGVQVAYNEAVKTGDYDAFARFQGMTEYTLEEMNATVNEMRRKEREAGEAYSISDEELKLMDDLRRDIQTMASELYNKNEKSVQIVPLRNPPKEKKKLQEGADRWDVSDDKDRLNIIIKKNDIEVHKISYNFTSQKFIGSGIDPMNMPLQVRTRIEALVKGLMPYAEKYQDKMDAMNYGRPMGGIGHDYPDDDDDCPIGGFHH